MAYCLADGPARPPADHLNSRVSGQDEQSMRAKRVTVSGTQTVAAGPAAPQPQPPAGPDEPAGSLPVADPEFAELGGSGMAAKYGLAVAGARPNPVAYARRLWVARHFIVTWATSRNQALYSGSRLGQLWQVLTPLLNVGVYYLIFGVLLGTSRGVPDFIVYLVAGVFIFNFMQTAMLYGSRAISDNLNLIRALYFPRASLPIAITIIQLQQLLIAMVILIAVALVKGEPFTWHWALIAAVLALQFVFNTGCALIVARLGAILTDTSQLLPFILRTWLYGSGVFYNIKYMMKAHPHTPGAVVWILTHNPPYVFIQLIRNQLITPAVNPSLTPAQVVQLHDAMFVPSHVWLWAVFWALAVGLGGYLYFWQGEETYGRG
jgi:teichoic acid transport system permease protein